MNHILRFFHTGRRARGLFGLLVLGLLAAGCGADEAPDAHAGHAHAAPVAAATDGERQLYTCGMHPQIVQEGPGFCPICSMALTPVKSSAGGEGVVEIDPATMQNIGVRTALVAVEPLGRTVRTTGRFEASEQGRAAVSPKVSGWVERLHVDYEGARVRKGQPLLELYSPELVATQEEYLLALRNARRLEGTAAAQDAQRLLEAARRRLAYWDISEAQIRRLEETLQPQKTLTLYAPASGTVTAKRVVEGQQVVAGETLLELADLSWLWLMVDIYEQDLAWVNVGTTASIELPYEPGQKLVGKIDYLYDHLDPGTRTVRGRVTLPNPGLRFKPGMYATVTLLGGQTEPVPVVPAEAVLRSGERDLVVLALGGGRFRPHEVITGAEADGRVQVLEGLQGGEEVVTSAQFLIDSEARLKSAVSAMMSGAAPAPAGVGAAEDAVKRMLVDVHAADADADGQVYQCAERPHLLQDRPGPLPGCAAAPARVHVGAAQALLRGQGYTNVPVDPSRADRNGDGIVWQSPMHWSVLEDGPGQCAVCNMTLERVTLAEARQNLLREGYTVR